MSSLAIYNMQLHSPLSVVNITGHCHCWKVNDTLILQCFLDCGRCDRLKTPLLWSKHFKLSCNNLLPKWSVLFWEISFCCCQRLWKSSYRLKILVMFMFQTTHSEDILVANPIWSSKIRSRTANVFFPTLDQGQCLLLFRNEMKGRIMRGLIWI